MIKTTLFGTIYFTTLTQWAFQLILWLSIFFAPVLASIVAILVFVVVDFVTGIWVAKRNGVAVTSKKMRDTVGKSVAYMIAILIAHIFQIHFTPLIPMMKIIALFIASAEIKSIYENLGAITGLDFWELIKKKLSQNDDKLNKPDNPA